MIHVFPLVSCAGLSNCKREESLLCTAELFIIRGHKWGRKHALCVHSMTEQIQKAQMREHSWSEGTAEAREARLAQMRGHAWGVQSVETTEAREARLAQMRECVNGVHRKETPEVRDTSPKVGECIEFTQ